MSRHHSKQADQFPHGTGFDRTQPNEELLVKNQKLTSQYEELNNKYRQLIKRLNDDQPFE
jgi:hypothetical protein